MKKPVFSLFSRSLKREIEVLGWERPTDIQTKAIPTILKGGNVLLIAPTGTGKTEAAVFPVFEQYLRKHSSAPIHGISIIYITPLRALNRDIFRRLIQIGDSLDIKVQVRHGDTPQRVRRKQAITPPDMLITTPETLQAILPGKRMSRHLTSVRWVIIDEVHELATNKRGIQLSVGLERLWKITDYDFQRIGLSATIGNPRLIASFLCGNGRKCQVLRAIESRDFEIWVESPTTGVDDRKVAKEVLLSPGSVRRIQRLFELIDDYQSSLIFTNTREHAEALSSRMIALRPQMRVGVHHGSLSRDVRVETEKKLKDGLLKTVVCTSSLELGIDVGNIEFIVQYLSPKQITRIVQRVGRSGHIVGGRARGCIIAAWPDDILESAIISKFALEGILEDPKIHEQALDVLAHQVAGLTLQWGRIDVKEVLRIVSMAWPYRDLGVEDLISVVKQLDENKIIWFDGEVMRRRYPHIFRYYYQNLSTIPDVKHYSVFDFLRRRRIGTLDQEFIAKNGESGQEFIMRGQTWKLINVDDDEGLVRVEPVQQSFGAIPSWEGEAIPVSFTVAQEVGRIRGEISEVITEDTDLAEIFTDIPINKEAYTKIIDVIRIQLQKGYSIPTNRRVLIEGFENYVIIHGCFGNRVNETLG
ncbi:MAG: DEAD/DEAH box helicase, partial [Candidatus Ranarchaeia archaeon]